MFNLITNHRALDFFDLQTLQDFFSHTPQFNFPIDIKETESFYEVLVETPGIKREDIEIEMNQDVLSITVYKDYLEDDELAHYIIEERRFGQMTRSFSIPDVNADAISAKYENGLLCINLPKDITETNKKLIAIE